MEIWGTIALFINVLLLFGGWLLFQQAKSDLTARAAQIPVLSEVKALQKSVASLLEQLKLESIQTSAQLDTRCAEARDLLALIDRKLEEARQAPMKPSRKREPVPSRDDRNGGMRPEAAAVVAAPARPPDPRREQIYALADDGAEPSSIARQTGLSEGEIELILGTRQQVS